MADTSTCTRRDCREVTPGIVQACPKCGSRVVTSRRIRMLGWVQLACGVFLMGFMGYILLQLYPSLSRPGVEGGGGGRFTGTNEQGRMILNLFWMIIAFGALATLSGVWQIVTGRRNMVIVAISLLAAAALLYTVWDTTRALKKDEEPPRRIVQPPPMPSPSTPPPSAPTPDKPQ